MADEEEVPVGPKVPKCLIVLTSCTALPDESATGYWAGDVARPCIEFAKHGWECDFASITGTAAADPMSLDMATAETKAWMTEEKTALLAASKPLVGAEKPLAEADYGAIFLAGGFGAFYDFAECSELQALVSAFYDAGKPVAAVSSATYALAFTGGDVKLLAGKKCTGMSTEEMAATGKAEVCAGKDCQLAMSEAGGLFQVGVTMAPLVVSAGNLFTGKNPLSSAPLATAIVYYCDPIKAEFEPPRLSLLAKREKVVEALEAMELNFVAKLGAADTAEKADEIQMKSVVAKTYYSSALADLDTQLERNASFRQKSLDARAAAAAAEE